MSVQSEDLTLTNAFEISKGMRSNRSRGMRLVAKQETEIYDRTRATGR